MADKDTTAAALELLAKKEARSAEIKARNEAMREARAGETKADSFKRIGANRTNSALDAISVLSNVFDKNNYDYTPEQAEKIVGALVNAVNKLEAKSKGIGPSKSGFEL